MTGQTATQRLAPVAVAMLEGLYQHRLLSTQQLHELYTPDSTTRWTQDLVARLGRAELVAAARQPGGQKVLYLTPTGVEFVEQVPHAESRRKLLSPEQVEGPLQRHTLAVNDVGIAFVRTARERGDEFGPLSWRHEIAHPIGPPPGRKRSEELIADAFLIYEQQDDDGAVQFHFRLLELDRATMPVDALAGKLARYARLYHHTLPAQPGAVAVRFWETRYPVFPTVAVVLEGASRSRLERRRQTVLALCSEDPDLRRTPEVEITACLLTDLQAAGPFLPIWRTTTEPSTAVDWLGHPQPQAPERGTPR